MKRMLLIMLTLTGLVACGPEAVVRDSQVYQTEVAFMSQAALQQADLLEGFVKAYCICDSVGLFTTEPCRKAAKTALVVRSRVPWHEKMMLYNAGLLKERPENTPPVVPDTSTLCP